MGSIKRLALLSSAAAAASSVVFPAFGQEWGARPLHRPSATQLLEVPVSGNPIVLRREPALENPYANDAGAIVQGRKLFDSLNCSGCHAPLGGGGMGPSLSDDDWIYGGEPAAIYLSIAQGRPNGMPAWSRALPPQSIWQLVTFVRTLGGASAPDAGLEKKPVRSESGRRRGTQR
ncbi:c-type cytochrome [Methylocaldum szegediense]|uniref:Cytochrome c oxidase cbb3-type subunit III n=1 Tax=Methylocaldum szegediense TaxID=73780 RepID=A0ABN8WWR2_9GAMM|nr:c-type cytochrome [Methylocaldum szegediense]CAI8732450.1 cytochrome c oxidase cbb3-type subunit III [Methylocaldum szegediense]